MTGWLMARSFWQALKAEVHCEIAPVGILLLNEIDLPWSMPVLDLLLAPNRQLHIAEGLEPDETEHTVAAREAGADAVPMLPNAPHQIRRDAGIESASKA